MSRIRVHIEIAGIVQGVGLRPFIHKAVKERSLFGWIRNTSDGAELELEGEKRQIEELVDLLRTDPPGLAFLEKVVVRQMEDVAGYPDFTIRPSRKLSLRNTLISPDVCTCEDCLAELFDRKDRRFGYPFINCTNCGPRFTIIKDVPYDRKNTTMAGFPMCDRCLAEYTDITDRRYHAQPDCCRDCGPALFFAENGAVTDDCCIERTAEALKNGKIAAIKGLGGFHLACRIDDREVVDRLRQRKKRDSRPFALMCRDEEAAEKLAVLSEGERKLLKSKARPIVLLKKKPGRILPEVSRNPYVGIMLPYTPVHHLLFAQGFDALVMTSANLSDLPIIYRNEEALEKLNGIADVFLLHNRDIMTRCDDSVLFENDGKPYFIRRSRGYVPLPDTLPSDGNAAILACGAEQKASFGLYGRGHLFRSQHIGDLKNIETLDFYEKQIAHFENLFDIDPEILVCDLHPDYLSTHYAEQRAKREGKKLLKVQHHYAHMASCMAEHKLTGRCIGIIWDGTGYGSDRTIWGGEFLYGDLDDYERKGSICPIPLPGSDKCMKELDRVAFSLGYAAGEPVCCANSQVYLKMLEQNINCPKSSGMGRLFDGVSALLSLCSDADYEGEGAVLLETAAQAFKDGGIPEKNEEADSPYPYSILSEDIYRFDWREMIGEIIRDARKGEDPGRAAWCFHLTLIDAAVQICRRIREDTGCSTAVLSGGTFQNRILLRRLPLALEKEGFTVYTHSQITTNDEGISAGQAAIALHRRG